MSNALDALADGERELALMRAVEAGFDASELPARALPFFTKLQIQTISPCNAACTVCPWPSTRDELPQGRMSDAVFDAVVAQIAGRGVERVGLFLMNEPTLDAALEERTARLVAADPTVRALIYTNGQRLDGARARRLARAGLAELSVSVIGFDRATYEDSMRGCDWELVRRNLAEIAALRAAGELGALDVRVVGLELPGLAEQRAAFEHELGLPVFLKPVTNRAGNADLSGLPLAPRVERARPCQRPFVKAYVLYTGDLVLCNCDWRRTTVFGNVLREGLEALWRGPYLAAVRAAHLARDPARHPLCAQCDYPWLA